MDSKYAVTDDIQTWSDVDAFMEALTRGRRSGELSMYDWESLYDQACEQVKSRQKAEALGSVSPPETNRILCENGHEARYTGIKKKHFDQ